VRRGVTAQHAQRLPRRCASDKPDALTARHVTIRSQSRGTGAGQLLRTHVADLGPLPCRCRSACYPARAGRLALPRQPVGTSVASQSRGVPSRRKAITYPCPYCRQPGLILCELGWFSAAAVTAAGCRCVPVLEMAQRQPSPFASANSHCRCSDALHAHQLTPHNPYSGGKIRVHARSLRARQDKNTSIPV
jgi:hypothetical protein